MAEVLFVCTRGDDRDGVFPLGLIQAANRISRSKRGVLGIELEPELVREAAIVVLHLHWDFNHLYWGRSIDFVRAANPGARIVVGGYIATVHPRRLLETYPIDFVIAGDYEAPFDQLVEAILSGRSSEWIRRHVPNVHSSAGPPAQSYRVSRSELAQLDAWTLDWFPSLYQYLVFQDHLNRLELAKWTEEQYFPAIIIKGSYNRHCRYCALSSQRFDGFCEDHRYTYLSEDDFVRSLERSRGWQGVNVFGDFAGLSLEALVAALRGGRFDFDITIGDIFGELDLDLLARFAEHFRRVWLGFRTLPAGCYVGAEKITRAQLATPYFERLLALDASSPHLSAGIWVNESNLDPEIDYRPYDDHFLFMGSWLRYPTQVPSEGSFRRLLARSERFEGYNDDQREVRVAARPSPLDAPVSEIELVFDPLTVMRSDRALPPVFDGLEPTLPRLTPDALGRFEYRLDHDFEAPSQLSIVVYDEKRYFQYPPLTARCLRLLLPAIGPARVEVRFAENIHRVRVATTEGRCLFEAIVPFTSGDLRFHVPTDRAESVSRAFAADRRRTRRVAPCFEDDSGG